MDSNNPMRRSASWGMDEPNSTITLEKEPAKSSTHSFATSFTGDDSISKFVTPAEHQKGPAQFGRRRGQQIEEKISKVQHDRIKTENREEEIQEIQDIPDLEDALNEDISAVVADAPFIKTGKVQTLQQLDQDIMLQLPTSTPDGVDVSQITNFLCPQNQLFEPEQHWDFEKLLQAVHSEMEAEAEDEMEDSKVTEENIAPINEEIS